MHLVKEIVKILLIFLFLRNKIRFLAPKKQKVTIITAINAPKSKLSLSFHITKIQTQFKFFLFSIFIFFLRFSTTILISFKKHVSLSGGGHLRHERLNEQRLHLPGGVGVPFSGVGVEQRRRRLLHQPSVHILSVVVPLRRLQQRQVAAETLERPRPENVRHRRCVRHHLRPRLAPATPISEHKQITEPQKSRSNVSREREVCLLWSACSSGSCVEKTGSGLLTRRHC